VWVPSKHLYVEPDSFRCISAGEPSGDTIDFCKMLYIVSQKCHYLVLLIALTYMNWFW